jgi:Holliday junction DNA helicase RuvA
MIAALRGTIARVEDEWVVLEVGGVGYQVYVHPRTASRLLEERGEVLLQIHTVVREDAISLFGFLAVEELACFRYLLTVERIGPKAALAILARAEWQAVVEAIMSGDHALLASVPGIGPKTAQRIVLELRGRVDQLAVLGVGVAPAASGQLGERAVAALVALGFTRGEAHKAVSSELAAAPSDGPEEPTIEEVVRGALQRLARGGARLSG